METHPVGEFELVQVAARVGVHLDARKTLRSLGHTLQEGRKFKGLGDQRAAHGSVMNLRLSTLLTALPRRAVL